MVCVITSFLGLILTTLAISIEVAAIGLFLNIAARAIHLDIIPCYIIEIMS